MTTNYIKISKPSITWPTTRVSTDTGSGDWIYYLWERREEYFPDKADQEIVSAYTFRANRSIEHLHPQHQTNNTEWSEADIHSFGNLAMISQSFNSEQSDDPVQVKFARIAEQASTHSLQSLKLFLMYLDAKKNPEGWTQEAKNGHQKEMYDLLKQSYIR